MTQRSRVRDRGAHERVVRIDEVDVPRLPVVREARPRAVVEEAFAEYVRGFMDANPGLDETFGAVFENIFMSLADDFVLPDPSEVAAAEAAARDSFAVELPSPPQAGRARKGKKGGKKKRH